MDEQENSPDDVAKPAEIEVDKKHAEAAVIKTPSDGNIKSVAVVNELEEHTPREKISRYQAGKNLRNEDDDDTENGNFSNSSAANNTGTDAKNEVHNHNYFNIGSNASFNNATLGGDGDFRFEYASPTSRVMLRHLQILRMSWIPVK